jgi:lipopolysaccharide export system permease protein
VIRVSPTLSRYLGWQFVMAFLSLLAMIMGLILLFDTIELMRRAVGGDAEFSTLLGMAFLKLPHTVQATLPFIVLVAMMFALFRLARSYELVVMRSAGFSVWQFLAPPLVLAGVLGILNLLIVDPVLAGMYDRYQRLEDTIIRRNQTALNIGAGGLWLREADGATANVVHAAQVHQDGGILNLTKVTVFQTDDKEKLARRLEAASGQLRDGTLQLQQVWNLVPGGTSTFHAEDSLPTTLTLDQVQESFAAPETMSIWELPSFIRFSQSAGFSALPHRMYWHSLLASPFLLCAMVLVASSFYLTANARLAGWTARGAAGLGTGFLLYFFSRFTYALGLSATLPLALAAWAPTAVAGLLGLAYLFHREDG